MNNVPRVLLSELKSRYKAPVDLFICAMSFEERSVSVVKSLERLHVNTALICCNEGLKELTTAYRKIALKHFGHKATELYTKLDDPLYTADVLLSTLRQANKKKQIKSCVVDVTTFTHETLLILLQVLEIELSGSGCKVDFIYTAASDYSLNEPNKEKKWLARGVGTVRSVLGYSGISDPSKKTHLVILTGFESERSQKLIDIYEPARVSLGVGREDTAVSKEHQKVNELNFYQLPVTREQVDTFSFSCTNPNQVIIDLENQVNSGDSNYNIVIAALNTKLSTVGVGLFAMEHPQIQLCYATANSYNTKNYSTPDNFCYIYTKYFEHAK